MDISELIRRLESATGPDRILDGTIALLLGYRRDVPPPGEDRIVRWLEPTRDVQARIPFYTSSLDDAVELTKAISPGCAAAVAWSKPRPTARVNDGAICYGATPAIALCIAALSEKRAKG